MSRHLRRQNPAQRDVARAAATPSAAQAGGRRRNEGRRLRRLYRPWQQSRRSGQAGRDALLEMRQIPGSRLVRHSRLYRSTPIGPQDQPDYVNAAAMLETALDPFELLDALQQIENATDANAVSAGAAHARPRPAVVRRPAHRQPAPAGPHPQMHRRAFVLVPLHEIAPQLTVPGQGRSRCCWRMSTWRDCDRGRSRYRLSPGGALTGAISTRPCWRYTRNHPMRDAR